MAQHVKVQLEMLTPEMPPEALEERVRQALHETFRVLSLTINSSTAEPGAESKSAKQTPAPKQAKSSDKNESVPASEQK